MRVSANSSQYEEPLIVLMLGGDSYSRRRSYQKLPKTAESSTPQDDFFVEDFNSTKSQATVQVKT
jgi:hypothetical protein